MFHTLTSTLESRVSLHAVRITVDFSWFSFRVEGRASWEQTRGQQKDKAQEVQKETVGN